ncbi:hypothetical protein QN277_004686 [Acacia crassicarpa]|uniref:Homeobox domain-containing protein n=1 Tax=Acacia crassicarpa TaxID=499986 RepID=A0AAE1ME09_9FABA|nr:hypothetical protein QN277_004686 [Acacia crassicarpa]
MSDSFKVQPLTTPNSTLNSHAPPKIIPFCICTHCTNLISLNHPLGEEGLKSQQSTSRWSPTPTQLLVLEELYRQGTKTPTAEQIQQIASQLRRFGKIEGKNVFYWFQNHKARERQKRRRREMEEGATASHSAQDKQLYVVNVRSSEEKQDSTGLRGTGYQVKETKEWASPNCSALPQEIADIGPKGWTQLEEKRTQVLKPEQTTPLSRNFSSQNHNVPFIVNRENCTYCDEEEYSNTRTLELFPLKKGDQHGMSLNDKKSRLCASTSLGTEIATSSQFFEFLPLKD